MNIAVGTVASATALASSSALAPAMPATPDPIFALIEQHRVAYAAVCAAVGATDAAAGQYGWDAPEVKPLEEAQTAVTHAMMKIEGEIPGTAPTTLPGVLAIMRYRREFATKPGARYDLFEAKGADEVWLATIEQSIAAIAGEPAPSPSIAVTVEPDPIFAAIEANRKADVDFIRLCDLEGELEEKGIELVSAPDDHRTPEMAATVDASIKSRELLAKTAPTTLAGLVAYIDYVRDWSRTEFLFDGAPGESKDFLESLQRSVHNIRGLRPIQTPHAVTSASADAELLALKPDLELIIRDYAALQAVDDWAEVDPDLKRWSALHDRMHPLVDRIMTHRPKTLAGLGVLTRAASLSYDDFDRENDNESKQGDLISAVCSFCGVEPVVADHEDEETNDEAVS
jgi:hypothetical protein